MHPEIAQETSTLTRTLNSVLGGAVLLAEQKLERTVLAADDCCISASDQRAELFDMTDLSEQMIKEYLTV